MAKKRLYRSPIYREIEERLKAAYRLGLNNENRNELLCLHEADDDILKEWLDCAYELGVGDSNKQ